jgi:hypothetical protein
MEGRVVYQTIPARTCGATATTDERAERRVAHPGSRSRTALEHVTIGQDVGDRGESAPAAGVHGLHWG